jgi:hypothetical protein
MIEQDGSMTLGVDDAVEKIVSAGPYTKENFTGYWIFGGPDLPASVTAMPTSKFYRGSIDDILCLDEANEYTTSYMIHRPHLQVSLTDIPPSCVPATILLGMPFSQKGIEYKVWDNTRSLWAPVSVVSDGGNIQFGGAEVSIGNNEFQIVAKNISTGCETVLDTLIVIEAWSVCTQLPEVLVGAGLKVYPIPAKDIIYFKSDRLIKEIWLFDTAGRIVYDSCPGSNNFSIEIKHISTGVCYFRLQTEADLIISGKVIIQN